MEKCLNYPVKYAVLELKEPGGWNTNYKDVTRGNIVSKCYVLESIIKYTEDGISERQYKVFFPHNNLETFKNNIRHGFQVLGKKDTDIEYNTVMVTDVFDTFEDAEKLCNKMNDNLYYELTVFISFASSSWRDEFSKAEEMFNRELRICKKYESLVDEDLRDMKVTILEPHQSLTRELKTT